MKNIPIYPHSFKFANDFGEVDQYRNSRKANVACAEAIDDAIRKNCSNHPGGYGSYFDAKSAAKDVVKQFGLERTAYVIANTILSKTWDARFSATNRAWASTVGVIMEQGEYGMAPANAAFVIDQSHPVFVNTLADEIRKLWETRKKVRR